MSKVNPIEHPDDFDSFTKWLEVFKDRNGGWYPGDLKGWFDKVEKNHKFLREKLGGVRKEHIIKLKSQQKPINMADAEPLVNEILELAPGYLEKQVITKEAFLLPTMQTGTHRAVRVGKDVRSYADLVNRYQPDKLSRLKKIDTALAKLGELWARNRTTESELEATISTSARSFVLLGHYGPDQDSCWRQGSDKPRDKYVLGQNPHTFTITIASKKGDKYRNVARCFGWTNTSFDVINTANYYFLPGFPEGAGIEVLKSIFTGLWNDSLEMHEDQQYIPDWKEALFHNEYARWTFTKGAGSSIRRTSDVQFIPDINMIKRFRCPRCRKDDVSNDKYWEMVDNQYLCEYCVGGANLCELTNKKTFSQLIEYLDDNGELKMVNPNAVVDASTCNKCEIRHAVQMHTPDKKVVCTECFEANYEECDSCHSIVANEEMCDVGEKEICNICMENGASPFGEEETEIILNSRIIKELEAYYG